MAFKGILGDPRTRNSVTIFIIFGICGFFYVFGAWQKTGIGKGDTIAHKITEQTDCSILKNLRYETHHSRSRVSNDNFEPCNDKFTDYTPCHDQKRAMKFPRDNMIYRERHCPSQEQKLRCLVPAPKGYVVPYPWPLSRDYVPYVNVPYKSLVVEKAIQNWVQYEGHVFRFPGGGTQFPQGAEKYIDQLCSVIPIANGTVRTALDTGCGVASLGAYLLSRNVLTMSFAPKDSHEAQVQFALERGVPAVIGVFGSVKLPYPSNAFDMAHCSRCLIPWSLNDGMYMMEVDRVLRPGGYWVLSGPPINWRNNYHAWQRTEADLEAEQAKIEATAKLLCWEKISEMDEIAIWRKRDDANSCTVKQEERPVSTCTSKDADDVWYKKMEVCVNHFPEAYNAVDLKPFPERLTAIPPRIARNTVPEMSSESYMEDSKLWKNYVVAYKQVNKYIDSGRYRNIMDMNAGIGSFAAAIESPKLWVMNVVPTISEASTLGVIYERGLIGIYHDWCEAFSTYPRTYDLIHANGVFSLYKDKCKVEDMLIEMDRILRPEGSVIIRDDVDMVVKVKKMAKAMRWNSKLIDNVVGSSNSTKVLFVVKQYWVGGSKKTAER